MKKKKSEQSGEKILVINNIMKSKRLYSIKWKMNTMIGSKKQKIIYLNSMNKSLFLRKYNGSVEHNRKGGSLSTGVRI